MDWSAAGVPAQPTASTVREHTAKLCVPRHYWARIEDAATVGTSSPLQPQPYSAVVFLDLPLGDPGGKLAVGEGHWRGNWLARHSTINEMDLPHRMDL